MQIGFADTMFGHSDAVECLSMLVRPRVLSCGGQDRSVRMFKVSTRNKY